MLLSITSKHSSARDLSYLLHKHPDRFQSYDLSFGRAHVFYPEVADDCSWRSRASPSTPGHDSLTREPEPRGQIP